MLVIILSTLDRYARENNAKLIGPSADFVRECVGSERFDTAHIRVANDHSPLPASTTHILLYGELAMQQWMGYSGIDAWRGYVKLTLPRGAVKPIPTVATYTPIDCIDIKDYEGFEEDDDDEDGGGNNKDTAPTARSNYRFWATRDCAKLFQPYQSFKCQDRLLMLTARDEQQLYETKNSTVYFDIETHPETNTLQCLSLAVDDGPVVTVGVYDWRGNLSCSPTTLSLLAYLFNRNRVVIHNSSFDLPFLAINYRVPFGRDIADTMVMHHRAFPEAEKSLAHAITLWINAPYHKGDAGTFHPRNRQQYEQLLTYNMRDVDTLRAVYKAQLAYAETKSGLMDSITQANASLYPYLVSGLYGFGFDLIKRRQLVTDLNARIKAYQLILDYLVGQPLNDGSSDQCARYFHDEMKYKVMKRSKKTNAPSLAGDALYLILLEYPANPVPKVILALRDLRKQLTQLTFTPIPWVHEV